MSEEVWASWRSGVCGGGKKNRVDPAGSDRLGPPSGRFRPASAADKANRSPSTSGPPSISASTLTTLYPLDRLVSTIDLRSLFIQRRSCVKTTYRRNRLCWWTLTGKDAASRKEFRRRDRDRFPIDRQRGALILVSGQAALLPVCDASDRARGCPEGYLRLRSSERRPPASSSERVIGSGMISPFRM